MPGEFWAFLPELTRSHAGERLSSVWSAKASSTRRTPTNWLRQWPSTSKIIEPAKRQAIAGHQPYHIQQNEKGVMHLLVVI